MKKEYVNDSGLKVVIETVESEFTWKIVFHLDLRKYLSMNMAVGRMIFNPR
jgi:hypothetical protein